MLSDQQQRNYRFPWQTGNKFELLVDGPAFFSAMLNSIQQARHYILLEMYLIQPGCVSQRFFQALIQARQNNVDVYLLLDAYGSRSLKDKHKKLLSDNDIKFCFYNPIHIHNRHLMLFRDHRKLLLIDGHTAYVGGAGLMDEFDSIQQPQHNWRENMVKIQGQNVLQWQSLFVSNWYRWSTEKIDIKSPEFPSWHQQGRIAITQGPNFLQIKRSFLNQVNNAKQRIWICTAYFVPSRKIRRALRRAAETGIDIRILIPGEITDHPMTRYMAQHYYSHLLRKGLRIYEYQQRFLHAKIVLCDNWVSLGSCNIDKWNLRWNLDANQEIIDDAFTASVIDMFQNDFNNSIEIDLLHWKKRSLLQKFKIWFWNLTIRIADTALLRLKLIRHWKKIRNRKK
jgi:phosphatidylserine/phosphatidylglycerophosphate/cardiolipin synthase-like enzyme